MSNFESAIYRTEPAITAELDLGFHLDRTTLVAKAKALAPFVDAVQLHDKSLTGLHVSPLAAAGVLLQENVEPIVHMTCRDRNRIALQSDLLGAGVMGVKNLLLSLGHKLHSDFQPDAKMVFDLKARDLVAAASAMKNDDQLDQAPDFFIGTMATVIDPPSDWVPRALRLRTDAGAQFTQTQACLDAQILARYLTRLIETRLTWNTSVVVSLVILASAEHARWLKEKVPGNVIPESVVTRLEQSPNPEQTGIDLCCEVLSEISSLPGIAGINFATTGANETISEVIIESGLRS